jgi:hypothetical protein
MDDKKVVLYRGTIEDWSPDNEEFLLKKRRKYAQDLIRNQLIGSPDFEQKYGGLLKKKSPPKD